MMKQIDAEDMQTLDALLPANTTERRTLADIIFAKLEEQEGLVVAAPSGANVIKKVQQGQMILLVSCYPPNPTRIRSGQT